MTNFMNTDATRLQNTARPTGGTADSGTSPTSSAVAAFEKALRPEDFSKEKPLPDREQGAGQSSKENLFSQMSNPLDSLFGKSSQQQSKGGEGQSPQGDPSDNQTAASLSEQDEKSADILPQMGQLENPFSNRLNSPQLSPTGAAQAAPPSGELIDTLVDRILLSQSKDGSSEIRISLNNSTLPDTEIRLVRGNDGQLTVHMLTNSASSFQTMVAAQDTLRLRLEQQEMNVRVEVSSQTEQENNDSRRQSRGYMEEHYEKGKDE